MTKNEAILLFWDMALARQIEAKKLSDIKSRDEWMIVIDKMEREWPWLKNKRHDISRLDQIGDGERV